MRSSAVSVNIIKYYIDLERRTKLNKIAYKKTTLIFILNNFYIKLFIGLILKGLRIKQ